METHPHPSLNPGSPVACEEPSAAPLRSCPSTSCSVPATIHPAWGRCLLLCHTYAMNRTASVTTAAAAAGGGWRCVSEGGRMQFLSTTTPRSHPIPALPPPHWLPYHPPPPWLSPHPVGCPTFPHPVGCPTLPRPIGCPTFPRPIGCPPTLLAALPSLAPLFVHLSYLAPPIGLAYLPALPQG